MNVPIMEMIDSKYNCTYAVNPEIGERWFPVGIMTGYDVVMTPSENYVSTIGRVKYIKPVYQALEDSGQHDTGVAWLDDNMDFYHPVAITSIEAVLGTSTVLTE